VLIATSPPGGPPSTNSRGCPQLRPLQEVRRGKFTFPQPLHTQLPSGAAPAARFSGASYIGVGIPRFMPAAGGIIGFAGATGLDG
jgi:hypothetical protein